MSEKEPGQQPHEDQHDVDRLTSAKAERQELNKLRPCPAPSERDPWAHRSLSMKCSTCMAYVSKVTHGPDGGPREIGRCRRHAPTMQGFPAVFPTDWCLDHKFDETKL